MGNRADEARDAWEAANGRKAGADDYYDVALERWVHYMDAEDGDAIRAANAPGGACIVDREDDYRFESSTLPKDYPHHKGPWGPPDAQGRRAVRFENQEQVRATIAAAHAAGEPLAYAGRRFNAYCDDIVKER